MSLDNDETALCESFVKAMAAAKLTQCLRNSLLRVLTKAIQGTGHLRMEY
jgi:hypothetical protein